MAEPVVHGAVSAEAVSAQPIFRLYPRVHLGEGCIIGDFAIIGEPLQGTDPGTLDTYIGPAATIRSHTVIYAGNTIGGQFRTGHGALIRESSIIGDAVSIGSHSVIEHHVVIEDQVRVHSQAFVPEYTILKTGCWIGPRAVLTNTPHPLCPEVSRCIKGQTIEPGARIGANATLMPAITVGRNAVVGAGAVVTRDVPPETVVVGNPAHVVKGISALTCPYDFISGPYEHLVDTG
ncbi:MAG: transferase [Dehalococcoidia bacterium]|nr:transferase [Dehalococcoidia bacterium]